MSRDEYAETVTRHALALLATVPLKVDALGYPVDMSHGRSVALVAAAFSRAGDEVARVFHLRRELRTEDHAPTEPPSALDASDNSDACCASCGGPTCCPDCLCFACLQPPKPPHEVPR